MEKNIIENDEEVTVTLSLDQGDVECTVVTVLDLNGRSYIALLPMEGPEADTGEVWLYRYEETDGEPVIGNIENEDEYEAVSDAFDEFLDSSEFDELVPDDEEG